MTVSTSAAPEESDAFRPACPFCRAPWTDAMLEQLDAMSGPAGCSCCLGEPVVVHWPLPRPAADLCCAACGKAIYRKV